jgi:hypothetical protein
VVLETDLREAFGTAPIAGDQQRTGGRGDFLIHP